MCLSFIHPTVYGGYPHPCSLMTSPAYLSRGDYNFNTDILTQPVSPITCPESWSETAIKYYHAPPLAVLASFARPAMTSELVPTIHFLTIISAVVRVGVCRRFLNFTIIHNSKQKCQLHDANYHQILFLLLTTLLICFF